MLSIVIPVYNNKEWLSKCFDSILSQTYKDYEVLIVDDCSTDGGIDVIREYEKKFNDTCKGCRVFINKTRRGNGGSRNVGIAEAQGEYTMAIDCDDWLERPTVLEEIVSKLNGEDIMFLGYRAYKGESDYFDVAPKYESMEEAIKGHLCALWTRVVKTDLLKEVLHKEGTLFEDQGHHYRLCMKAKSFTCLGKVTHVWNRLNTNSISNYNRYEWDRFQFCREMYEIIQDLEPEYMYLREYFVEVLKMFWASCNEMVERL